ncbi:MAG: tRNA (N6-isopentenyl adenosine(37)-C2)-methylthiotransferase MiaB [Deltaproteobacteria bacterium]|nr:tRNA (N6-isopentenyl adenosine(37)-C2)-methylthiotransferase MiaB [Deltaproteobacteria bacterium]
MEKKFYLETFGCQMNVVDSEQIAGLLEEMGYEPTSIPEEADLILLNTCTIREKAERKVVGHLWQFKPLKESNPELIIAVGGCVAQQEGERLLEQLPHVGVVFGTHNIHRLPEMIQNAKKGRRSHEVAFLDKESRLRLFPTRRCDGSISQFVTVMQGCDNFCAYCVVPHVRGREISRPSTEIVAEVRRLAENGTREVTLVGQNVNSYGNYLPDGLSFAGLLVRVHEIPEIERIRFVTSHPRDISDELIKCFADLPKLCSHIHLPFQSGSDRILGLMGRGYSRRAYLDKVAFLKRVCPDIRLTTDIIVGFPGETEEDFQDTLALVEEVRFADAFTFLYSPRPNTRALNLQDETPGVVKQQRFQCLLDIQEQISLEVWAGDVGKNFPVLVEGESRQGNGQIFGRTVWNRIVNFNGGSELIGRTVPVKIIASYKNSQLGESVKI